VVNGSHILEEKEAQMAQAQDVVQRQATRRYTPSLWFEIKKSRWAYLFISPFYILFAIFQLVPLVLSLWMSFTRWKGVGPMKFEGLINFSLVPQDKLFWQSMLNGVIIFIMYVPLLLFMALVLAVILSSGRVKGYKFFRTIIFLPFITNMVAAGFTFQILLEQNSGLVNVVLGYLGLPGVPWLENIWWARVSLCLLIIWAWLGYDMVIMLAGLQTIPHDYTEAALVDGASPIQAFFRITIPLMRPIILFLLITSTIGTFSLFTEVYILTNQGGPVSATLTPMLRIYKVAFDSFQFGYAAALSYTYFAIIFVLALFQFSFNREKF
jgi:ABC-type sugar transport system permease subunit